MSFIVTKTAIYLYCTILLFIKFKPEDFLSTHLVKIENGKIIGEEFENFYAFKGIPYAQAERFELPQRITEKWRLPRVFKEFGNLCA